MAQPLDAAARPASSKMVSSRLMSILPSLKRSSIRTSLRRSASAPLSASSDPELYVNFDGGVAL
jgi:hypothetical protein